MRLSNVFRVYRARGLLVLAVAVDQDRAWVQTAAKPYRLAFPVLVDTKQEAQHLYEVDQVPQFVFINAAGERVPVRDPESGNPVKIVVGSRLWDSPEGVRSIEAFLKTADN